MAASKHEPQTECHSASPCARWEYPSDAPTSSRSGAEAVRAFERTGWRRDRQRGSHLILIKPGHPASLSVPQHRELAPGTLRALIRSAAMTVEEFLQLL
ncbi:MAG: type II toxin-antitoxin system HicA family toxin [bacterium]|nr:type II toxin-antitoxin system HicA family toxin [bacterium]